MFGAWGDGSSDKNICSASVGICLLIPNTPKMSGHVCTFLEPQDWEYGDGWTLRAPSLQEPLAEMVSFRCLKAIGKSNRARHLAFILLWPTDIQAQVKHLHSQQVCNTQRLGILLICKVYAKSHKYKGQQKICFFNLSLI